MTSGNRKPNLRLQELRINRGLSPEMLGHLTGLTGPTIRLAERGHTPHPRTQFLIAEFFGLASTDLFPLPGRQMAGVR